MSASLQISIQLKRAAFDLTVDLSLLSNAINVIYGRSGCGKTSLLRALAGLEPDCHGRVQIGDTIWQDDANKIRLPTWQRSLAYVFQEASLFEHLSVQENIEYAWRRRKKNNDRRLVDNAIELLHLAPLLSRTINGLSGGEKQRIALARALASAPQLLLLDEPLASIDTQHRDDILPWLERVRDQLAIPMIYVTHSMQELTRLADYVVVLEQGEIQTQGALNSVLTSLQLRSFMGDDACCVIHATVVERDPQWHLMRVMFEGGELWLRDNAAAIGNRLRLRLLARDISISVAAPSGSTIQNHFPATIVALCEAEHPSQYLVQLRCHQQVLLARITKRAAAQLQLHAGQTVCVQIKSAALLD